MGILVNQNQIGGNSSNTSRNIGDIFYTTRTDNSLNGAVECNGSQYNFSDFDSNLQALFDDGSIPSVTINKFDSMLTNQGGCDSFGYGTNELIIYPVTFVFGSTSNILCYTNITNWVEVEKDSSNKLLNVKLYDKDTHEELVGYYVKYMPETDHYYVYNNSDEYMYGFEPVYPYIDGEPITLPTGGEFQPTTYFKVPKKVGRVLVRTQKPTSSNKYTYFNLYADGWVEQGGTFNIDSLTLTAGTTKVYTGINFPIELKESPKIINIENNMSFFNNHFLDETTTSMSIKLSNQLAVNWTEENKTIIWKVSGYAIESEYTKDKWNYQNVQVERPMIQLFNSTTDTAVATCNQVLADVSALNQGDYVIETQLPTAENNYSWYRLYKSGWVEQGGEITAASVADGTGSSGNNSIILPVIMANEHYHINLQTQVGSSGWDYANGVILNLRSTTKLTVKVIAGTGSIPLFWQVSGMSAQK